MFAFLITSHRNPAIDCCKCPLIFSRALHYLTFVLNTRGRMTSVCLMSVMSVTSVYLFVFKHECVCAYKCVCEFLYKHVLNENRSE